MTPITYDRLLGVVENYRVIDLFPYKFKDASAFIHRNHVPYIEGDRESLDYALEIHRRCTEGFWVDDGGTPIWMPPKLYFYLNLGTIEGSLPGMKSRSEIYPGFRDNEWIAASYLLCCDGFSGFKLDPDFTCNVHIKTLEEGGEISNYKLKTLQKNCTRKDGTWKKYIEAWDYLTWFYNKENSRGIPLGLPLYENDSYNGLWLAARGIGKTYWKAAGDAAHEFWTNGSMYYDELANDPKVNMMLGASDTKYVKSYMEAMRVSFTNIPGKVHGEHPWFTKFATNDWDGEKGTVTQQFRKTDGTFGGSKSVFNKTTIPINKPDIVVSTRSKLIDIDEIGLLENARAVYEKAGPTLESPDGKFGRIFGTGTGGNVDKIIETQYLYTHCSEFLIYSIPNYWENGDPIGLFGPASYGLDEFKDINGNTDLISATKAVLAQRDKKSGGDKSKQTDDRMNKPMVPSEIFLSGKSDIFDKDTIIDRIDILLGRDYAEMKKKGVIYDLELGAPNVGVSDVPYNVIATPRENRWGNLVTHYFEQSKHTGEILVFEPPMGDGREFLEYNNLYKVVYDPKTDLETGESFLDVKVWKGRPQRPLAEGEMFHNIVATAKLKRDDHLVFMLMCLWYRAKGQYERNVSGIPDFFGKYNLKWLLQPTPIAYIKDITPGSKQSQQSGIFMTDQLKREALTLFKKFHKATVHIDGLGRKFKNVETWFDISLLYEMNYYDAEKNFDDISAMLILMLWLEAEYMPEDSVRAGEGEETAAEWMGLANVAERILAR